VAVLQLISRLLLLMEVALIQSTNGLLGKHARGRIEVHSRGRVRVWEGS
jgi:hypothetical protein